MGHNQGFDFYEGRNGAPTFFTQGLRLDEARAGDLHLVNHPTGNQEVLDKGLFVIAGPDPYSLDGRGDEPFRNDLKHFRHRHHADLWIETGITRLGAIMEVPGSVVRMGPVSGIVGMTTFWMMVADACRILARKGVSSPVMGDEPDISTADVPDWHYNYPVDTRNPLMDLYFETLLDHLTEVRGEYGRMREVAALVVDALLDGGRVFCYSRNRNQLAVEGNTRRGGLAMFNGIFDGGDEREFNYVHAANEGITLTDRDCVVMGFTRPDDPVDLDNLDRFRKIGMKIAAIGPPTRDWHVPEGSTIPKEVRPHLGDMIDTYGLFRVPGFRQKVCPTSGAVVNQIYWATCMEIVEQFMARTGGDVPAAFANVAIRGGRNEMRRKDCNSKEWRRY